MDIIVKFVLPHPHSIPDQTFAGCDLFTLPAVGDTLRVMNDPAPDSKKSVLHVTGRSFSYGVDEMTIEIIAHEARI